jgi:hypothetical protein
MLAEAKLVEKIWPQVWPLIEQAVTLETEEDVLGGLLDGTRFLLIIKDGVAVIRPCETFLEVNYVGGKNAKEWWPEMSAAFDTAAKAVGLNKIVAVGTDAWKKIAPEFTPTKQRIYTKEVA